MVPGPVLLMRVLHPLELGIYQLEVHWPAPDQAGVFKGVGLVQELVPQ